VEINSAWETIRENIKILAKESQGYLGYFELKKHKPWFDEGCSKFLDQRKQAKLQWLRDTNEINGDNLNNVRREASRHFRNKKKEYLKLMSLQRIVRTTTSETCIEEYMDLRGATNLEIT
jgi:hypothetical protein